jgi:hypothetical protein
MGVALKHRVEALKHRVEALKHRVEAEPIGKRVVGEGLKAALCRIEALSLYERPLDR